jgi:hypothetical protein
VPPLGADDITLEYSASLTVDNLPRGARQKWTAVTNSKTLAYERTRGALSLYVHGNSDIVVKRGGNDISSYYAPRRRWRAWTAAIAQAPPNARSDPYASVDHEFLADSENKPAGDWHDAPGLVLVSRQTTFQRVLYEWVIGVEHPRDRALLPGAPGIYIVVIADLAPTEYRLWMSKATDLTETELRTEMGDIQGNPGPIPAGTPWKTEDTIATADWAARHTTWQTYATYNNQLPLAT